MKQKLLRRISKARRHGFLVYKKKGHGFITVKMNKNSKTKKPGGENCTEEKAGNAEK